MIFTGDVAIASGDSFSFHGFPNYILSNPWCINLEGAVSTVENNYSKWAIYNSKSWFESFENFNLGPIFIGNNHISDISEGIKKTKLHLDERGINCFGAGNNEEESNKPVKYSFGNFNYYLAGFGWPVIGCAPSKGINAGVNQFEEERVISQTKKIISEFNKINNNRIIIVIHGNYEFELYPQPGHRSLAKNLIDLGVHAVIFHHPHIVGPIESYKNRIIAYSLGNWAFSFGKYYGGILKFPESSFKQIAIEIGVNKNLVHHANFSPPNSIEYNYSEDVNAPNFSLKAPFEGLSDKDYTYWFKQNRIKRKGLPIYCSSKKTFINYIFDKWVFFRACFIKVLLKVGLKRNSFQK